jgi:hypothetical protein
MRHLLKNVDDWSEGKIILKFTLILKNLNCLINKNVWLKDIDPVQDTNPVQDLTPKFRAVKSGRLSERDTEPACFVSLSYLYITWSIKTSQGAPYSMELLNMQHRRNVHAVSAGGILRRISEFRACRHETDNTAALVCLGIMSATWPHSNSAVFGMISTIQPVVMNSCPVQILEKLSV